jgi:protein-disulfide isomerase
MKFSSVIFGSVFAVCTAVNLNAAGLDSTTLQYEGRIKVAGKPYSGTGSFFFSMENGQGEIIWTSGDFPFRGSTDNPTNVLKLAVTSGAYEVRLGDTTAGMPPLNRQVLGNAKEPRLKIWFNDGVHGWQPAGVDVPLDSIAGTLANNNQSEAMLQELRAIHALLERQNNPPAPPPAAPPPPATATVTLAGSSMGQTNAPLVLVEFTDYQCPYCKRFQEQTMPELLRKYVDTGKLRIVSRNLPLPFHSNAESAAQAALCASQQGKYESMRDNLFARSIDLPSNLLGAAAAANLELAQFTNCLSAKTFAAQVQQDSKDAAAAGITGTPSFVLGKPQGDKVTGLVIVGALPTSEFEAQIEKLINVR